MSEKNSLRHLASDVWKTLHWELVSASVCILQHRDFNACLWENAKDHVFQLFEHELWVWLNYVVEELLQLNMLQQVLNYELDSRLKKLLQVTDVLIVFLACLLDIFLGLSFR